MISFKPRSGPSFKNSPNVNYACAALCFIFNCTSDGSLIKTTTNPEYLSYSVSPLVSAIHQVESGGRLTEGEPILGDWCPKQKAYRSRGPLQISKAAHADALEHWPHIGGTYTDVDRLDYSISIFNAYMSRYANERRLGEVTKEKKARIWNGGPNGHIKKATLSYWAKVESCL